MTVFQKRSTRVVLCAFLLMLSPAVLAVDCTSQWDWLEATCTHLMNPLRYGHNEVLLSGYHEKIRAWRLAEAEAATKLRRPDLWAAYEKQRPQGLSNKSSRRKED